MQEKLDLSPASAPGRIRRRGIGRAGRGNRLTGKRTTSTIPINGIYH
eukprot:SAG31_NODE_13937_length_836_cov_1.401628_1_plen_46_part_10